MKVKTSLESQVILINCIGTRTWGKLYQCYKILPPILFVTGMEAVHALDKMVAQCMEEFPDDADDDEDMSDIDDPELLAELQDLSTADDVEEPPRKVPSPAPPSSGNDMVSVLEERINNYKIAIANAKTAGESSKARRAERGLKVSCSNCSLFYAQT